MGPYGTHMGAPKNCDPLCFFTPAVVEHTALDVVCFTCLVVLTEAALWRQVSDQRPAQAVAFRACGQPPGSLSGPRLHS